jgi:hypothetical protein
MSVSITSTVLLREEFPKIRDSAACRPMAKSDSVASFLHPVRPLLHLPQNRLPLQSPVVARHIVALPLSLRRLLLPQLHSRASAASRVTVIRSVPAATRSRTTMPAKPHAVLLPRDPAAGHPWRRLLLHHPAYPACLARVHPRHRVYRAHLDRVP